MKKYEHIVRKIQDYIRFENLTDGARLPSVRTMAKQMGVSVTPVVEGYGRLESLGLIESRPQSGYYVRPKALRLPLKPLPEVNQSDIALRTESVEIPSAVQRLVNQCLREDVLPLGSGLPDSCFFPSEELSLHLARAVRNYPEIVNRYHIKMGHESLVERIAKLMLESGCLTKEDEIVVAGGENQALMLALRALVRPGDTVAVESPGHSGFFSLLQFFNLDAVEIPCNPQHGLDVKALESILNRGQRPACVLLSANYSNPTGALMPDKNKESLVRLCSQFNLPIIEDDTYGELTFSGKRPQPLKALDPSLVIYLGNFGKFLAPGYGVSWLAGGRYTNDIRGCYGMSVMTTPVAQQLALASMLEGSGLKRHLRRLRKQYEENMRLFQATVARCFPSGTRISNPQGGQFLWVELPLGYDAVELSIAAIRARISIAPGVVFSSRQYYRRNFRLNCAIRWSEQVEKGIEQLGYLAGLL